jgi:hypothetical protein
MSSAHKKVIVRRFTGETLPGYLPLTGFMRNRTIEILDLGGRVIPLVINEVKHISMFATSISMTLLTRNASPDGPSWPSLAPKAFGYE